MEGFEALYSQRLNPSMAQAAVNSWTLLLTIAQPVLIRQLVERYIVYCLCCYCICILVDNFPFYTLYWDQILLPLK